MFVICWIIIILKKKRILKIVEQYFIVEGRFFLFGFCVSNCAIALVANDKEKITTQNWFLPPFVCYYVKSRHLPDNFLLNSAHQCQNKLLLHLLKMIANDFCDIRNCLKNLHNANLLNVIDYYPCCFFAHYSILCTWFMNSINLNQLQRTPAKTFHFIELWK